MLGLQRGGGGVCVLALLALMLGGVAPAARSACADDAPATLDAKARTQRRSELKSAAMRWAAHRLRFPSRCPVCQGTGAIRVQRGAVRICNQCKGRKAWISPPDYRAAYYELRSPAFQRLPGIQDALERQYKEVNQGKPWPTRYDRYRIREWELVDETHGVVWILFDAATVGTATYWVWSTDTKKKGEWYVYDSRADGVWPTPSAEAAGGAAWEAVPGAELTALRNAAAGSTTTFWAVDFLTLGDTLRVRLEPRATTRDDVDHADLIAGDALALFGPLFSAATSRRRIETEWRTLWRNVDGFARLKPTWTVSLDRSTFEARGWQGLSPAEQMGLLVWTPTTHTGWQRVAFPTPAPTPAPALPPPAREGHTPEIPIGPAPTTPEPEPGPVPAPPNPTPPAPPKPPPAPEPVAKGPPPEITAKARKTADAGIARMREILTTAKAVYDEAQQARAAESHDLWQEKLEEVRARLGEIQDVWLSQVVAAMPGRDEGEQEELANEHFSSVWGDVDELKSIVRKISRI